MTSNKTEHGQIGKTRRIVGDVLLFVLLLLTVDVLIVMLNKSSSVVLKSTYQKNTLYELILCGILILLAMDIRFNIFGRARGKAGKAIGLAARTVIVLISALILFLCGRVVVGGLINTSAPADYALVLGMALQNGKPTEDLMLRLDTAEKYLEDTPGAVLILSGGNADASGRTEAKIMQELLTERGVSEERLLLEEESETTADNFLNTAKMLPTSNPVVLITSNYHMDRALNNARRAGFEQVLRLPAPSDFFTYGSNMLWEVLMDINEF